MRCYYLMTKWRCDTDVTVYIIFAGHEYTANKFDHRSFKEAFFPGGSFTSRYFWKKTRLDLRKRWRSRGGGGGGEGNQAYSFPASQKNRYPKDTCVRYLICIKGYDPMTVVWDTTGFPRKQKSNYAQITNTTCLYCFVGRLCHQAKSCLTSTFYLRMC